MVSRRPLAAEVGASYHVEFVEDKVALGQNLLSVLRVFLSLSFYQFSLLIYSVIYHSYSTGSGSLSVVGPCHHGMTRPHVADRGTASFMEGSCE